MPQRVGEYAVAGEVAAEFSSRLSRHFLARTGRRPDNRRPPIFVADPHGRECVLIYGYFHGADGEGLGASHRTGWTALIAKLLTTKRRGPVPLAPR